MKSYSFLIYNEFNDNIIKNKRDKNDKKFFGAEKFAAAADYFRSFSFPCKEYLSGCAAYSCAVKGFHIPSNYLLHH